MPQSQAKFLSLVYQNNVVVSVAPSWFVLTCPHIIMSTELQPFFIPGKFQIFICKIVPIKSYLAFKN